MELLITGTRTPSQASLKKLTALLDARREKITKIWNGGAKGTDRHATKWAKENGVEVEEIRPDYQAHHYKTAPLERNTKLVQNADAAVCVWSVDGRKGGTLDTVKKAQKMGLPIIEILATGEARKCQTLQLKLL